MSYIPCNYKTSRSIFVNIFFDELSKLPAPYGEKLASCWINILCLLPLQQAAGFALAGFFLRIPIGMIFV